MTDHFQLPRAFDVGATAAFALTGAFAGVRRGYDVVGVFFLAAATALGGGLLRDGIFLQSVPVAVRDPVYLETLTLACGLGILLAKRMRRFERWIMLGDALGLGAYAVVGTQMSLLAGLNVLPSVIIGVLNATGGGLLRDVLAREEPFVFKPGEFYVLVALVGAVIFVVLLRLGRAPVQVAAEIAIGVTFVVRLLTVRYRWRTQPASGFAVD